MGETGARRRSPGHPTAGAERRSCRSRRASPRWLANGPAGVEKRDVHPPHGVARAQPRTVGRRNATRRSARPSAARPSPPRTWDLDRRRSPRRDPSRRVPGVADPTTSSAGVPVEEPGLGTPPHVPGSGNDDVLPLLRVAVRLNDEVRRQLQLIDVGSGLGCIADHVRDLRPRHPSRFPAGAGHVERDAPAEAVAHRADLRGIHLRLLLQHVHRGVEAR